ncbi:ganglioside GM2 activator-like [Gigantopelta aegis]|uniref:ganglioside GM2 activator-like n=1 Tax=Gigantopelta aegis TaxID=1735272 RepID=UPI001B88C385|nr:ganglioside GM2 activator-like [Gigantopelta aegis]
MVALFLSTPMRCICNVGYGKDPTRPIHFYNIKAHPMPIIIPGTLYVSMVGNVTHDLPRRITIEMSIMKYFFGIPFMIPCFDNRIGSCTYNNICQKLERYETNGCPRTLRHFNMQCHCPLLAGEFTILKVPGDYELVLNILDENKKELVTNTQTNLQGQPDKNVTVEGTREPDKDVTAEGIIKR